MEFLVAIIALVLLVVVILVVSAPLRAAWGAARDEPVEGARGAELDPAGEDDGEHETEREDAAWDGDEGDRGAIAPAERRVELEAAREAKYREIRDTELDYRTGKLSQEDFAATDSALRAEAVEILDWLDALDEDEDEGEDAS
jgi:hypothetical protein